MEVRYVMLVKIKRLSSPIPPGDPGVCRLLSKSLYVLSHILVVLVNGGHENLERYGSEKILVYF